MKRIQPIMTMELPDEGHYAVLGRPVPVSVHSLEDACLFIDEMCSDILEPCRDLEQPDALVRMGMYAGIYSLSLDDFIQQVNALDYRHSRFEKVKLTIRKKTIVQKLEILVDDLSVVPDLKTAFEEIMHKLNLHEKNILVKAPQKERAKEDAPPLSEPLRITSNLTRRYISDYLVDAFARTLEAKKVLENLKYARMVRDDVSKPDRRLHFKIINGSVLAATALTAALGLPLYFHQQNAAVAKNNREVALFQESLEQDDLDVRSTQYVQRSNALLDQIKDFKEKGYWLPINITANFYLCYKKLFKDTPGLPPLRSMNQLRLCIDELQARIAVKGGSTVDTYLDNFVGFSTIVAEKVEELRRMESQQELGYQQQLQKIQRQEQKGYELQDLRASVQAAQNTFYRGREKFHLQFAAQMSPVEFYALALADLEFRKQVARGSRSISSKMFRAQTEANVIGATMMNDYIALESVDAVKPDPFWKSGGYFDNALIITHNLHKGWK